MELLQALDPKCPNAEQCFNMKETLKIVVSLTKAKYINQFWFIVPRCVYITFVFVDITIDQINVASLPVPNDVLVKQKEEKSIIRRLKNENLPDRIESGTPALNRIGCSDLGSDQSFQRVPGCRLLSYRMETC